MPQKHAHARTRKRERGSEREKRERERERERERNKRTRARVEGAGSGDRGCTLTHRHKINTFFSLHRRPGDNHEIMWPARASERHRNVWLPLRSVITHPRRAKPPPSVATCYVSLHRRQLSGNVYSRFRYGLSNRSSRGRRGLRGLVHEADGDKGID